MVAIAGPCSLVLPKGAVVTVPDLDGVQLHCREGSLWLTLDHDLRDVVLEAGDRYTGSGHKRAVLYALASACVTLRPASVPARATAPSRATRLAAWFAPAHA